MQKSDGDGGAGEKKEGKTEVEMAGQHQELVGERICSGEEAQDRVGWRRLIRIIDPTLKCETMRKKKKKY